MPIPAFEPSGLLPAGMHECTLDEVKARFGSFQGSERRPELFARLSSFIDEAISSEIVQSVIINGSFATAESKPNDIDLVVIVCRDHDFSADLRPVAYNVVSRKRVQKRFGFDIVAAREGTPELREAIGFFQRVRRAPTLRKGVLRIRL